MTDKFDIIDYLSGLTGYIFDKAVLKCIALDRKVLDANPLSLDQKTKDLLRADLLYTAYTSPSVLASSTQGHGSFTHTIGSQTTYEYDKERIYGIFIGIYRKYNDDKLIELDDCSTLQWL